MTRRRLRIGILAKWQLESVNEATSLAKGNIATKSLRHITFSPFDLTCSSLESVRESMKRLCGGRGAYFESKHTLLAEKNHGLSAFAQRDLGSNHFICSIPQGCNESLKGFKILDLLLSQPPFLHLFGHSLSLIMDVINDCPQYKILLFQPFPTSLMPVVAVMASKRFLPVAEGRSCMSNSVSYVDTDTFR